jgi:hypothetical protein
MFFKRQEKCHEILLKRIARITKKTHLPYSSTSMPSISLIGSSIARSARDGRLRENPEEVSSFEPPISSI